MDKKILLTTCIVLVTNSTHAQNAIKNPAVDSQEQVSFSILTPNRKTMIALTFGQSNAGNRGQIPYTPHNESVLNYYEGKLYRAKDPLLGATGPGGSVWTHLGDLLIDSGLYKKVIFIPIAIGNTDIECWATGECFQKLKETLKRLDSQHIKLTHIFWHQGESDNLENTPKQKYKASLKIILQTLRNHHQQADFYVSIASYHNEAITKRLGVDPVIRQAQKEFISENKGVIVGPDTDQLIYAIHRYDGVHFSGFGMKAFANLWLKAIKMKRE
jgi:Carbohydrate esterase, sialic acid-specific acetylesterase